MTRKDFNKKYDAVIKLVAIENEVDMGVGSDMLISSIRGNADETYKDATGTHFFEIYSGIPEDFDFDSAYEDYKEMIKI